MRRFRLPLQWSIPLGVALLLIAIGVLTGSAANAQYPGPVMATGGNAAAPAGAVGTPCTTSTIITGSLTVSDTTEADRLSRAGGISSCATPKTCPGPSFVVTPTLPYDSYTFSNPTR